MLDGERREVRVRHEPAGDEALIEPPAKNARVAIVPGTPFGKGSDNHMRMNIATSRQTLKTALDSISAACKKA